MILGGANWSDSTVEVQWSESTVHSRPYYSYCVEYLVKTKGDFTGMLCAPSRTILSKQLSRDLIIPAYTSGNRTEGGASFKSNVVGNPAIDLPVNFIQGSRNMPSQFLVWNLEITLATGLRCRLNLFFLHCMHKKKSC